jgi:hypothetical protein
VEPTQHVWVTRKAYRRLHVEHHRSNLGGLQLDANARRRRAGLWCGRFRDMAPAQPPAMPGRSPVSMYGRHHNAAHAGAGPDMPVGLELLVLADLAQRGGHGPRRSACAEQSRCPLHGDLP